MSQFPVNPPSFTAPPTTGGFMASTSSKLSVMAVLSLVIGILGLCTGITGILGVIFGIIAFVHINRGEGQLRGRGMAIAGTALSTVAILLTCLSVAVLFPALAKARAGAMGA